MQRRAEEENLPCMSIHSYVRKYLKEYPELLDVLSATSTDRAAADGAAASGTQYAAHVPMNAVLAGIRSRQYFRCVLRCAGRPAAGVEAWSTCYAIVHKSDGTRVSVTIEGEKNVNRALDGDVVAIEILEGEEPQEMEVDAQRSELPTGVGEVMASTAEASSFQIEGLSTPGDKLGGGSKKRKTVEALEAVERGRVVGIIRRNWRQYAGSMVPLESVTGKKGPGASNFLIGY